MQLSDYSKFVAAALPLIAAGALHFGVDLGDGWIGQAESTLDEILVLLTPFAVYLAPKNTG